jgi:class 3 adenylate cyclase
VRVGLELVAAVGSLKTHAPLQARISIATGLVVVRDLIGSGASEQRAIIGETPNLAGRLQGVAEPNAVVITENTRKLAGNLFEIEEWRRCTPCGARHSAACAMLCAKMPSARSSSAGRSDRPMSPMLSVSSS